MLRLDRVIKPWKEAAALTDHINLYGFWNETAFLTKSGDLGMVLRVPGVDYESLDQREQEYAVKRLEAALKAFGPGFHVYQYLFKSNRPDVPFARYDDPIVEAAIDQRRQFFEAKRDYLYQVEIFYCVLLEGARSKTGVGAAIARLFRDPMGAIEELRAQFTNNNIKSLLRSQIEHDLARLDQRVQAFTRQLADFVQIDVLKQDGQFRFFRRLLNYDDWRVAGHPQYTQFLDYQVVNKELGLERGSYAQVVATEPTVNLISVQKQTGDIVTYDPSRLRGIDAYRELERSFAVGDRIQMTAPCRDLDLSNRALGTIEQIAHGEISARMDNGNRVSIDPSEFRHFDHGYAVTSHSSQGLTTERVLVNMDTEAHPELINTRFAYVSVSRASHSAEIFTNDALRLGERLSHDVTKTSATEHSKQKSPEEAQSQRPASTPRADIGLELSL